MSGINPIPEDTTNALLKPIAQSIGGSAGTILQAGANLILSPLRKYNIRKDQELKDYANNIKNRIDEIPIKNRDDSKTGLIIKAIDDSKYRLNEPLMRDAFSRLIAKGLDNRVNANFYPSYSEILSNMSALEAELLKIIYDNNGHLVATQTLIAEDTDGAQRPILPKAFLFDSAFDNSGKYNIAQDLLVKSGVISSIENAFLTNEYFKNQYSEFELPYKNIDYKLGFLKDNEHLAFKKGYLQFTNLGNSFTEFII